MNTDVAVRLAVQVASMIINQGFVFLVERWNTGVRMIRQAQNEGRDLTPEETAFFTSTIRSIGDELLAIETNPPVPAP